MYYVDNKIMGKTFVTLNTKNTTKIVFWDNY